MLKVSAPPAAAATGTPAAVAPVEFSLQCRRRAPTAVRFPTRCSAVELSSASAAPPPPAAIKEKGLAERLRMGRLEEDGLSFKECFIVRCYEVGINKTATVETIANLLQVQTSIF